MRIVLAHVVNCGKGYWVFHPCWQPVGKGLPLRYMCCAFSCCVMSPHPGIATSCKSQCCRRCPCSKPSQLKSWCAWVCACTSLTQPPSWNKEIRDQKSGISQSLEVEKYLRWSHTIYLQEKDYMRVPQQPSVNWIQYYDWGLFYLGTSHILSLTPSLKRLLI